MFPFTFKYFKRYHLQLIITLFLTFVMKMISILNPLIYAKIIDTITISKNFNTLIYLVILLISIGLLNVFITYGSNQLNLRLQTNIAYHMITNIFIHVHKLQLHKINNVNPSHLNEQINSDANSLSSFILDLINNVVFNILTLIYIFSRIYLLNRILSLYIIIICFLYYIVYIMLKRKIYSISFKLKENKSRFFSKMMLQIEKLIFIRRHSLSSIFLSNLDSEYNIFFNSVLKSQKFFYAYSSLDNIVILFSSILIFIIGGKSVITNNMSVGNFTIIFSYFSMVLTNLNYFTALGSKYQSNLASYNRINNIYNMDIDSDVDDKIDYETYEINKISCENISFDRAGIKVINNFSYTFTKGNSYCIYGDNGSGKTTLLDILIGLYKGQYRGVIQYNNVDIKQINMDNIRKHNISLLEQHTNLINGDLKDNIFLHKDYTSEQLKKNTFQNPNIFINMSLNKVIDDYINNISGGELQKIGILRLLSKKASVFILDEPTNSLDLESIELLKKYINYLKVDNIVILVNHDPSLMGICDYKIKI